MLSCHERDDEMEELRKDLLIRVLKILIIIFILFALWQIFSSDAGKSVANYLESVTKIRG